MDPVLTVIVLTVIAGIVFDVTNGWNDSANAIATVVSTRVLSPAQALTLSACLNFLGALVSIKVAKTMGAGVVSLAAPGTPGAAGAMVIVLAAMIAAAAWVAWCTRLGLPISCSHALVGGLVGATVFVVGWGAVQPAGLTKILVALLASPVLGFIIAYVVVVLSTWGAHGLEFTPRQGRKIFGFTQLCSSSFMAFEHGKNDAQKVMGVIALALFAGGYLRDAAGNTLTDVKQLYIPTWVILACAGAMAFGTAVGGWRVIRTLGSKLAKITTVEGFAAETGAGTVLEIAASLGVPVSTTHTITGGIVGVGAAKGVHAVKWGIGAKILWAWVFTLPVTFLVAGSLSWFAAKTTPLAMVLLVVFVTILTYLAPYFRGRPRAPAQPPGAVPLPVHPGPLSTAPPVRTPAESSRENP